MSTDRDVERIVRSWLDEGVTALPDRVLDLVLDQLPATPQRRSPWSAWRFRTMNGLQRIAAVAAAAALVIIGLALFKLSPNVGQPTQSPSPTAISTPIALEDLPGTESVKLAAGTYAIDADFPVRVSFTLPAGWNHVRLTAQHVVLSRGDVSLAFTTVLNVNTNANPCQGPNPLAAPPVGPSVDDLVTALTHLHGTESGTVSDVSIDGSQGKSFDLHVQRVDCNLYGQSLWKVSSDREGDGVTGSSREQLRVYVMDVRGQRIVFVTSYAAGGPNADADKAELQTTVDSIHILPAT